jgi:hypothetical protein
MVDTLRITKERGIIKVRLEKAEVVLGEEVFPLDPAVGNKPGGVWRTLVPNGGVDIHFDTVLLTSIDKLLKRNRMKKVSPLGVVLEGFEDESSMVSMIARTVAEALKIK